MKKDKTNYNSEITKEDLRTLGDKEGNLKNDLNEDEYLKERKKKVDFTGKDLDIPGRSLPKNKTKKVLKDEENQMYSLGSDDNENLKIDTITNKK
jgi:hypothetical protein